MHGTRLNHLERGFSIVTSARGACWVICVMRRVACRVASSSSLACRVSGLPHWSRCLLNPRSAGLYVRHEGLACTQMIRYTPKSCHTRRTRLRSSATSSRRMSSWMCSTRPQYSLGRCFLINSASHARSMHTTLDRTTRRSAYRHADVPVPEKASRMYLCPLENALRCRDVPGSFCLPRSVSRFEGVESVMPRPGPRQS